jgi:hypothetical protein
VSNLTSAALYSTISHLNNQLLNLDQPIKLARHADAYIIHCAGTVLFLDLIQGTQLSAYCLLRTHPQRQHADTPAFLGPLFSYSFQVLHSTSIAPLYGSCNATRRVLNVKLLSTTLLDSLLYSYKSQPKPTPLPSKPMDLRRERRPTSKIQAKGTST